MALHDAQRFEDLENLLLPGLIVEVGKISNPSHEYFCLKQLKSPRNESKIDFLLLLGLETLV